MDTAMDMMGGPSTSTAQPSLAELLQQSRKLNTHSRADLPSIQLGLDQIEAQSRKLAQARATTVGASSLNGAGIGNDAKAHYFLANGGIDASGLADTINQTDIANAFEPLQPIYDTDVDSYLRHSHEQVILSAIEEGRRETLHDFHRNLIRAQTRDWEVQKMRILEELGQHQNIDNMRGSKLGASTRGNMEENTFRSSRGFTPGRSEFNQSQAGVIGGGSIGNARVGKYQSVVERLNKYRLDSTPFALASAFGDSIKSAILSPGVPSSEGPQGSQDVIDCWQVLSCLVGETDVHEGDFKGVAIRERQYANAYMGVESQRASDREKRDLRKTLVSGALTFLNRHLSNHIESRIAANPVKAQLGGRPNTISKIVAFERATFTDREGKWSPDLETISTSSGTVPAWCTIFYLLCSGNAPAALDFVSENDQAFRKLDGGATAAGGGFLSFFKAWLDSPDGNLPKLLRDRFMAEYNSRFRGSGLLSSDAGSIDVYKQSLYRLIGRIDVNKSFPIAVTKDTETWLWLQLSLVREGGADEANMGGDSLRDQYTLQDLGNKIDKFGEDHFDAKGSRPLHYFMLLLLCSQFEKAIGFLYSRPQYQVDAVNFAVALTYYGLLRVPAQSNASHIDYVSSFIDKSTGQEIITIDFAKLMQKYIRLFTKADAKSALQYVYLVCLNSDARRPVGEEQTKRCHDLIRALVVESRQYFELLGDIGNDGTKTAGLIEQNLRLIRLQDSRDFLSNIVGAAAVQSENENRTRDAILLYNIAEEYDRVIDVVNRELSSSLVEPADPRTNSSSSNINANTSMQGTTSLAAVEDIAQLASAILDNYEKHNHIQRAVSPRKREVCRILLTLKTCFQLFAKSEWEKTLNILESLDLIPFKGDVVTITRKAESFKDVDDNIGKNFSEILLLAMTCISKLYLLLKDTPFGDASRQQRMAEYRNKARALMLFAGMLRLRIEPSTFSQLTRLDVYLH